MDKHIVKTSPPPQSVADIKITTFSEE